MPIRESQVFNALAIRDTSNHFSDAADSFDATLKTILIENGLNQTVTFQLEGSRDEAFTKPINVGNTFDVATNINTYQVISDYFPYLRLKASCLTAPTTGTLSCYFEAGK